MIALLPGLGGDARMYAGPWRQLPGVYDVTWRVGDFDQGLSGAATAVRSRLPARPQLLIGSSMGGMVACELSWQLGGVPVVLLGSALNSDEINLWLRPLITLAPIWPWRMQQAMAAWVPSLKTQMFAEQPAGLFAPMLLALQRWQSPPLGDVLRLHGRYDPLLRASQADCWLPASHVIAMSHPAACVAAIRRRFSLA